MLNITNSIFVHMVLNITKNRNAKLTSVLSHFLHLMGFLLVSVVSVLPLRFSAPLVTSCLALAEMGAEAELSGESTQSLYRQNLECQPVSIMDVIIVATHLLML